jgi:hypothetical protein
MENAVRRYMALIGRRGGKKSRRRLDSKTARAMVRVREARRAYRRFHTQCFWSFDPKYLVTDRDIEWVCDQLMKHGGREAWEIGARLCR